MYQTCNWIAVVICVANKNHRPFTMCVQLHLSYILLVLCDLTMAQQLCAKIDFDRTTFPEFRECKEQRLPQLYIKEYLLNRGVPPYKPTSRFFLSNNFYGFSCVESNIFLTFNQHTSIEAALYLKSIENGFVEINIYDANLNALVKSIRSDGTQNWDILRGSIDRNISNARVSCTIKPFH